jgi:putative intracellular protease/amidase
MKISTVHLFAFNGMADWEPAFAIACIHNPQFQLHPGRVRVRTVARSMAPLLTMGGVRILPDMTIESLSPAESRLLILPGGQAWESGGNLEALERAHAFLSEGVPVAAICAATLALARTGLLDDRMHTSNDETYLASSGYRGGAYYRRVPAITDRNLITAAGFAPVEFAREIAKELNLYPPSTLDAWYSLFKHGDGSRFQDLVAQPPDQHDGYSRRHHSLQ